MSETISAPGKLLLAGEYAVRDGAPALVTATSRRVVVRSAAPVVLHPGPELVALHELCDERGIDTSPMKRLGVDVTALRENGIKLGLGSSAAGAVALAGALLHATDPSLSALELRKEAFSLAHAAHRRVSPQGSGVDVAASTFGETFFYSAASKERVEARVPAGLVLSVIWSGSPARTSDMIESLDRWRDESSAQYGSRMRELETTVLEVRDAWIAANVPRILAAIGDHHGHMRALGNAAGIPIVTPALDRIHELAAEHGGAAKPSGAGGGDIAVAFFSSSEACQRFERSCAGDGLTPVLLQTDQPGLQVDEARV